MIGEQAGVLLGGVTVHTTSYRGSTPEEIAERAIVRIISVGEQSHPAIREQALAFQGYIKDVLIQYLREAQNAERTTICGTLIKQGHQDLANLIRSI